MRELSFKGKKKHEKTVSVEVSFSQESISVFKHLIKLNLLGPQRNHEFGTGSPSPQCDVYGTVGISMYHCSQVKRKTPLNTGGNVFPGHLNSFF